MVGGATVGGSRGGRKRVRERESDRARGNDRERENVGGFGQLPLGVGGRVFAARV